MTPGIPIINDSPVRRLTDDQHTLWQAIVRASAASEITPEQYSHLAGLCLDGWFDWAEREYKTMVGEGK